MAAHSSAPAWRIPGPGEPGGLQSMGSRSEDTTERLHFPFSLSCPGEGNGNPFQCSCLENPRGGGAWWALVKKWVLGLPWRAVAKDFCLPVQGAQARPWPSRPHVPRLQNARSGAREPHSRACALEPGSARKRSSRSLQPGKPVWTQPR